VYLYCDQNPVNFTDPDGLLSYDKNEGGDWEWNISSGDTMTSIAKETGFTIKELLGVNSQITDANTINAGATINIPQTERIQAFQWASQQVGSTAYAQSASIDNFAAKTNKCSKFVADAYTKGASISDYPTKKVSILGRNNPIQANDLANKYSKITGPFAVTLNPKIGDIAAYGHYESVGHVAMVGIGKSFISASKDKVFLRTENFMGQHGFSNPTYRTYQPK